MTQENEKVTPDREDQGVRIEIHGEDEPVKEAGPQAEEGQEAAEESPDTAAKEEAADTKEAADETAEEKPEASSDRTDDAQGQADAQDEEAAEGEKDESQEGSGDKDGSGSDQKSGKGFFGFRNKKDKKDERIEQLTDQVARQLAEFDNYRKRTDREKADMFDMGKRDTIEKILPVVDNFERGLGDMSKDDKDPFRQGMIKIYRQLMKVLDDMGVKVIEAEGKPFDPELHNAVMHCEDESVGENIVVQDLQKGYMLNDKVIRHSMVKVAN